MKTHFRSFLFLVDQLIHRPAGQDGDHLFGRRPGALQVLLPVVAALGLGGAGDGSLIPGDEVHGLPDQVDGRRRVHVPHQEVEAGAAAHGAGVDHLVRLGSAADVGGKEVLKAVDGAIAQVGAAVGPHHADVVGNHVPVHPGGIHALGELPVIHLEAGDLFEFHCVLTLLLAFQHTTFQGR